MGKQAGICGSILRRAVLGTSALALVAGAWPVRLHAANITTTWDGTNGDWFDPAHWSSGAPNNSSSSTFSAIINNGTVSLADSATINNLTLISQLHLESGVTLDIGAPGFFSNLNGLIQLDAGSVFSLSQNALLGINSSVSGAGTFQQIGGQLQVNGQASIDNFVLAGGSLITSGTLTINNSMTWVNGTMSFGNVLIGANATLQFMASANQTLAGTITNAGLTQVTGTASYRDNGTFINSGTLTMNDPATTFSDGSVTNTGLISLSSGTLSLLSNSVLGGTVALSGNAAVRYGGLVMLQNAVLVGTGNFIGSPGGSLEFSGVSTAQSLTFGNVVTSPTGGTLNLQQSGLWNGGTLTGNTVHVLPGALLVVQGTNHLSSNAHLINDGTVSIGVDAQGNFFAADLDNAAGASGSPAFTNNGTLIVEGAVSQSVSGTLTNNGLITNYTAAFNAPANFSMGILNNGTISGGLILGQGTNNGLLSGDAGGTGRTLTLAGQWTLNDGSHISSTAGTVNSTGSLVVHGQVSADHLVISGGLSLVSGGTLHLAGPNAFAPSASDNISGSLDLLPGSDLDISSTLTLTNATLSSAGLVRLLGGQLVLNGRYTLPDMVINGGSLGGGGSLTITHELDWVNPGNFGINALLIAPNATANISNTSKQSYNGNIANSGFTLFTGPFAQSMGAFTNNGTLSISGQGAQITTLTLSAFNGTGSMLLSSGVLDLTPSVTTLSGTAALDNLSAILTGQNAALNNFSMTGGSLSLGASASLSGQSFVQNLSFGGSAVNSPGTLHLTGTGLWNSGALAGGRLFVDNGATLIMTSQPAVGPAGVLVNNGTVSIGVDLLGNFTNSNITINSASFFNNGTLIDDAPLNGGTLTNAGLFTSYAPVLRPSTNISAIILNTGTISGSFILNTGTSSGLLSPDAGPFARTLTLNGAWLLQPGAVLSSAFGGLIRAGTLVVNGVIPVDHTSFNFLSGSGTLTPTGPTTWAGTIDTAATLLIPANGQITLLSAPFINGTVINNGTLGITTTVQVNSTGKFINNGTIFLDSTINGLITNNNFITQARTTSASTISLLLNNGTVSGPFVLLNGGTNNGMISPDMPLSPRSLTLSGPFTLNPGSHLTSANSTIWATTTTLTLVGESFADHLSFSFTAGSGTLDLSGPNALNPGGAFGSSIGGVMHVLPAGTVTITSTTLTGKIINDGIAHLGGTVSGTGKFINNGVADALTGSELFNADFYNTGSLTLTAPLTLFGSGSASGSIVTTSLSAFWAIEPSPLVLPFVLNNMTFSGPGIMLGTATLAGANVASHVNMSLTGSGSMLVTATLAANAISNGAQVTVLPTGTLSGFTSVTGATLTSQGAATFNTFNPCTIGTGGRFINQGSMSILTATFSFTGQGSFENQGFMTVSGNGTSFNGNGTLSFFSNTGTVTNSSLQALSFSVLGDYSGTFISGFGSDGFQFNGNGGQPAALRSATLVGSGFLGSVSLTGVTTAQNVNFVSISGPGSLTLSQYWVPLSTLAPGTGGILRAGAHVTLLPSATTANLVLPTPQTITIDAATLTNQGAYYINTNNFFNNATLLAFAHGGVFDNQGRFTAGDLGGVGIFASDGSTANTFINSGTFSFADQGVGFPASSGLRIDAAVQNSGFMSVLGNATFNGPLNNTGVFTEATSNSVSVLSAVVYINGGGTATGRFDSDAANGAINAFTGETVFSAPYTLNSVSFHGFYGNSAPLTLIGTIHGGLTIGGDLVGPGTYTGGGAWVGGSVKNAGGVIISGTDDYQIFTGSSGIPPEVISDFSIFNASGTSTKSIDGSAVQIAAGTQISWSNHSQFTPIFSADAILFRNGGQFINNGTFYTFLPAVSLLSADGHTGNAFINTGIFGRSSLTPNSFLPAITTVTVPFHNSGLVDIQQGSIDFAGGYFNDGGGTIQFAAGAGMAFSGGVYDFGGALDLGAGGLRGTGTIEGNVDAGGTISPGNSPGALTVDGDLHLAPTSQLIIELAGFTAGSQYDTLTVTGTLHLDGTLWVSLLGGFLPEESDSFQFLTTGSLAGMLANAPDGSRFADNGSQGTFLVSYSGNAITLSDFQATVPEPLSVLWLSPAVLALLCRGGKSRFKTGHSR